MKKGEIIFRRIVNEGNKFLIVFNATRVKIGKKFLIKNLKIKRGVRKKGEIIFKRMVNERKENVKTKNDI